MSMGVFQIAFDAGSIVATLEVNRNPFTAGLAAAKQQVAEFKRRNSPIEIDIRFNVDQRSLMAIEAQLKRINGQRVKATAQVLVERLQFDKLLRDLKAFNGKTYSANLDVDAGKATAEIIAFKRLLASVNDQTVNLSANTRAFGRAAGDGFGEGSSHFQKLASAIILALPVIASGFTAAVGAVGALASALVIAGAGAGAFALVAVPAFKKVKDAVAAGQAAIDKLPPGLREAGNGLKELENTYQKLITTNQFLVGIALSAWFNAGTAALKTLNPLIEASAKAFALAGVQAIRFFNSPWWQQFVQFLSGAIGPAVDMLFKGIFALIQIIGNLTQAFWNLGGSEILGMIVKGLQDFATYTERIGQNKSFQEFMEAAKRSLPEVGKLLGSLIGFILKLAIGLEPLGTLIVRVLTGIFDALNKIPPPFLQAIALGFAAIWAAIALGAGGPVGIAIGVLIGLGAIFADAYTKSETLRTGLQKLGDYISAKFAPVWKVISDNYNQFIKPAWDDLVARVNNGIIPALEKFFKVVVDNVVPVLIPFVNTITKDVIPAILGFLGALNTIVTFLINTFGPTVARELRDAVTVFDGAFKMIAGLLNVFTGIFTLNWDTFLKGLRQIAEGILTIIAGLFGTNYEQLKALLDSWGKWTTDKWNALWNGIISFTRGVWDTIKLVFSAALDLLQGNVSSAADKIGVAWRRVANFFREPINWVIRTVIGPPGGIAGAWNTVMGWIGQPQLSVSAPPQIPAFADGGRVRGPGTGTSDEILARISNGEYVVPERITKKIWPFLDALRAGQTEALQAAGAFLGRGVELPKFAGGGVVAAQQFAQSQHGPYVWGGVGPNGYDCSGFMSAIANVALGQYPYSRRFATGSFSGPGSSAGGFVPGLNSAFGIGVNPSVNGGAGHTAGTIGGLNAESSSGVGPHTGSSARGATNGLFPWHFSLPQVGGQFIDGGGGGAPVSWWSIIANQVTSLFKNLFGGSVPGIGGAIGTAIARIPVALIDKVIGALKSKLEALMTFAGAAIQTTAQGAAANPLSGMGTADRGAIIPPGPSVLFNATGRPEPLTNLDVYERMKPSGLSVEDVLAILNAHGGGAGGGDVYNVMLPEKASVRELADSLDFKRRVVRMGRYSR